LIISVALSFSRTGWLILIFSLFVYFEFYRKPALILFLVLIVLILSFLVVGGYETNNPLLNKFMNPTSEFIQFDNWNIYDINNNWRGYENFLTREVLENAPFFTQLFGFGAGYSLPLDVTIKLGGDVHSEIFILHSAYSYLLLKTGIIGVLLYLFFLLHLFYIAIRARDMEARSVLVIAGIIFFTSFAISGLYNKVQAIPFMIFLGCSINIFWERKR
jgi:O-antigen ligase